MPRTRLSALLLFFASSTLVACRCGGPEPEPTADEQSTAPAGEGSGPAASGSEAADGTTTLAGCEGVDPTSVALLDCGTVMTAEELNVALADMVERYERLPGREPTTPRWRNERRQRLVRTAVQEAILAQHVASSGVEVSDDDVEARIRADLQHVYDDERLFARFLESHGTSREEYIAEIRAEIALDRLLDARARATCPTDPETTPSCRLEPTDDDVRVFYEQNRERWREGERVRASVITVRLRSDADEAETAEARARIEAIRERVTEGGEDFATVARAESESADRLRGGDRGWIVRGRRQQLVDDGVEDILFRARVGTVTEPIRTSLGFQIFYIADHRPEGFRDLDEVREILHEPLRRRNRDRLSRDLETELAEAHNVTYVEDNWGIEAEPEGSGAPEGEPTVAE